MRLYPRHFTLVAIVNCLLLSCPLKATETIEDYRPLLDDSPFLSQAFKDRIAKSDASGINSYRFVGYTQIAENWRLCLIKKKTNIATWIQVGESIEGYTLKKFAPKHQMLSFEKSGITAKLTIDKPK
jgi:hypothetical protein